MAMLNMTFLQILIILACYIDCWASERKKSTRRLCSVPVLRDPRRGEFRCVSSLSRGTAEDLSIHSTQSSFALEHIYTSARETDLAENGRSRSTWPQVGRLSADCKSSESDQSIE